MERNSANAFDAVGSVVTEDKRLDALGAGDGRPGPVRGHAQATPVLQAFFPMRAASHVIERVVILVLGRFTAVFEAT